MAFDFEQLKPESNVYTNFLEKQLEDLNIEPSANKKNTLNDKNFKEILKNINIHPLKSTPFVNGYFYIHMQTGSWSKQLMGQTNTITKTFSTSLSTTAIDRIGKDMGKYIFNTELPNLMMETETISGRLRNINYATKAQLTSDFSISYHDTKDLELFSYHHAWFKFIELLRRGDITYTDNTTNYQTSEFIDVPYYNAMWVLVFYPHSVTPVAIFKLMGITPINAPLQSLIGDRGNPSISLVTQSYKCNDMIFDIKHTDTKETDVFTKLLNEFTKVFSEDDKNDTNKVVADKLQPIYDGPFFA